MSETYPACVPLGRLVLYLLLAAAYCSILVISSSALSKNNQPKRQREPSRYAGRSAGRPPGWGWIKSNIGLLAPCVILFLAFGSLAFALVGAWNHDPLLAALAGAATTTCFCLQFVLATESTL